MEMIATSILIFQDPLALLIFFATLTPITRNGFFLPPLFLLRLSISRYCLIVSGDRRLL